LPPFDKGGKRKNPLVLPPLLKGGGSAEPKGFRDVTAVTGGFVGAGFQQKKGGQ